MRAIIWDNTQLKPSGGWNKTVAKAIMAFGSFPCYETACGSQVCLKSILTGKQLIQNDVCQKMEMLRKIMMVSSSMKKVQVFFLKIGKFARRWANFGRSAFFVTNTQIAGILVENYCYLNLSKTCCPARFIHKLYYWWCYKDMGVLWIYFIKLYE